MKWKKRPMNFVVKFCILVLLSMPLFAKVTLRFKNKVYTSAENLADVVEITGNTPSCDLHDITLGGQAIPNEIITKDTVIRLFKTHAACAKFDMLWLGKTQTPVKSAERSSPEALIQRAKETLSHHLAKKYKRFELKASNRPYPGEHELTSYQVHFSENPSANVCVWLESDKEVRQVWFKVKAWCDVWVAQRPLKAKTKVKPQDYILEERECPHVQDIIQSIPKNKQIIRQMAKGDLLLAKNLEQLTLIRRGDTVKVRVKEGAIALDTQGLALSDGALHQKISIKNPQSNKTFKAIVTGTRQAEVCE